MTQLSTCLSWGKFFCDTFWFSWISSSRVWRNFRTLSLKGNNLAFIHHNVFNKLANLTELDLSNNKLKTIAPDALKGLKWGFSCFRLKLISDQTKKLKNILLIFQWTQNLIAGWQWTDYNPQQMGRILFTKYCIELSRAKHLRRQCLDLWLHHKELLGINSWIYWVGSINNSAFVLNRHFWKVLTKISKRKEKNVLSWNARLQLHSLEESWVCSHRRKSVRTGMSESVVIFIILGQILPLPLHHFKRLL